MDGRRESRGCAGGVALVGAAKAAMDATRRGFRRSYEVSVLPL